MIIVLHVIDINCAILKYKYRYLCSRVYGIEISITHISAKFTNFNKTKLIEISTPFHESTLVQWDDY